MFDPSLAEKSLQETFNQASKVGFNCKSALALDIPDNREPEISFFLQDMSDAHSIYEALLESQDAIVVAKSERTSCRDPQLKEGVMISLGQDTVTKSIYDSLIPTRIIELNNLTLRSRFSIVQDRHRPLYINHDMSVKTAVKNTYRQEWEAGCGILTSDLTALREENPTLPPIFSSIDSEALRVSSACLTARAVYSFLHFLPKQQVAILYDVCNDACVMTTPHADIAVGYRKEFEAEAKCIYSLSGRNLDDKTRNDYLDISLDIVTDKALNVAPGRITAANESKLAHAQRVVSEHYMQSFGENLAALPYKYIQDGTDIALAQDVKPESFAHKMNNILMLATLIPSASALLPQNRDTDYRPYFRPERLSQRVLSPS